MIFSPTTSPGFIWILLKAMKAVGDAKQVGGFCVSHSMLVDIEVSLALVPVGTRAFFMSKLILAKGVII